MKRWLGAGAVFLVFLFWLRPLLGQDSEPLDIPRMKQAPKIDGKLDNPLWENQALKLDGFLQFTPVEKGEPTEKTIAYLGYDEKNLYVAFRCFDSEPKKIRASVTSRDNIIEDDWVVIFIDTFNEKRRAFSFIINPYGIQMDLIRTEEGGSDRMDASWDTVFSSDGKIDGQGYTVEMAIPFKSLRFPDKERKLWSFILGRTIQRTGEIIIWPPMSRDLPGLLCQASECVIRGEVQRGKNFELMPILTALKTEDVDADFEPGINFKWGITSDHTMDMTLNPDFSHIEADAPQIDINQRFALYYPEKRPFFLEGMEIFQFPELQVVYTRRITDPLFGAKLTGKAGRFTYGLLSAYDTSPTESLWDVSNGNGNTNDNALFNIFRFKTDVFKESYLGMVYSDKIIDGSYNRLAGLDGQFKFKEKYFLSFQAVASRSRLNGKETDVAPAVYVNPAYYSKHLGIGTYWMSIHPEFEAASGFVNRVDFRTYGAYVFTSIYPEKSYLNQMTFSLRAGERYRYYENIRDDWWVNTSVRLKFTEFSQMNIEYQRDMERFEGIEFRKNSVSVNSQLIFISWLPFGFFFETGDSIYYDKDDPYLGYSNTYVLWFTVKPSKRLRIGVNISKQTFWEKWGEDRVYDFNVIRARTTYQFTKTLSLRAILDYNHYDRRFYGSFLASWVLKPGTVFFLGVDNNYMQNEFGRYARNDYSVFLKFSYWWRL